MKEKKYLEEQIQESTKNFCESQEESYLEELIKIKCDAIENIKNLINLDGHEDKQPAALIEVTKSLELLVKLEEEAKLQKKSTSLEDGSDKSVDIQGKHTADIVQQEQPNKEDKVKIQHLPK